MEAWEILCLCVAVEECVPAKVVRVLSNMAQMHVCTCARTHTHTHTHTPLWLPQHHDHLGIHLPSLTLIRDTRTRNLSARIRENTYALWKLYDK